MGALRTINNITNSKTWNNKNNKCTKWVPCKHSGFQELVRRVPDRLERRAAVAQRRLRDTVRAGDGKELGHSQTYRWVKPFEIQILNYVNVLQLSNHFCRACICTCLLALAVAESRLCGSRFPKRRMWAWFPSSWARPRRGSAHIFPGMFIVTACGEAVSWSRAL